jgi:hypothetical protein
MNKLASNIVKLAKMVESASIKKTADKWVRFTDANGQAVLIPRESMDPTTMKVFSPYTRGYAKKDGVFTFTAPKKLDEAFGIQSSKEASINKQAAKLVMFQTDAGQSFALPFEEVGRKARWVWSPWNRGERAMRVKFINVPMSGVMEEGFGLGEL